MTKSFSFLGAAVIAACFANTLSAQTLEKIHSFTHSFDFSRSFAMYEDGDGVRLKYAKKKSGYGTYDFINKAGKVITLPEEGDVSMRGEIVGNNLFVLSHTEKGILSLKQYDFSTGAATDLMGPGVTVKKAFEDAGVKFKQTFEHNISSFSFINDNLVKLEVYSRSVDRLREFSSILIWDMGAKKLVPLIPNGYPKASIENEAKHSAANGWAFQRFSGSHLYYSKEVYGMNKTSKSFDCLYYITRFNVDGNHEDPFTINPNTDPGKYTLTEVKVVGTTYEAPGSFMCMTDDAVYTLAYAYETADAKKKPVFLIQKTDLNGKQIWNSVHPFYEQNEKNLLKFNETTFAMGYYNNLLLQINYAGKYYPFKFDSKNGELVTQEQAPVDPNKERIMEAAKKEAGNDANLDLKDLKTTKVGDLYFVAVQGKNKTNSVYVFKP